MPNAVPSTDRSVRTAVLAGFLWVGSLAPATAGVVQRPATWTIEGQPILTLGRGSADTELFTAVVGATRLTDGRILVGDRGAFALTVFDPKGKLVKQLARRGRGPGEVQFLHWLLRCGNEIFAGDMDGDRVTAFSQDWSARRPFRFTSKVYRASCNPRAQFAMMGWEPNSATQDGVYRSTSKFWISDTSGVSRVTLGDLPSAERFGMFPRPLGRDTRVAIGRERAYVATADSFHVHVFDLRGRPLPGLRTAWTPVPATAADLEADLERTIAVLGERSRKQMETELGKAPLPRFLPATRDLVVDADDNLWVQHYPSASRAMVQWTVFSPTGRHLANVQLPTVFELYEAGRDYVLGRYIDADEAVPEVRMYRLKR